MRPRIGRLRVRAGLPTASAILAAVLLGIGMVSPTNHAAAQTPAAAPPAAPDFGKLGFPTVAGSASYTPGTAATIAGTGGPAASIPADFYKNAAKIELLTGSPATFAAGAGGRTVLALFALRVTDTTSNQIVATGFGSPWVASYTNPAVTPQTIIMNVTAATPPAITVNPTPPTISGQTVTHPFTSASVGWLVANPGSNAPSAVPAAPPGVAPAAAPRPQTAAQAPVKGPVAAQAPAKGPVTAQAPALAPAAPAVVAPRLPSTGSGGLLSQEQPEGISRLFLADGLALFVTAGAFVWLRRRVVADLRQ